MGWLGFTPKTNIFSSFFSTLHSTNKTNNQQNASKWGISWMCEKHTDSDYKSYNTNRDPLAKQNKTNKQTNKHSMFVVVSSLDLVTVHVYKKTYFPLQKHLHYFVYSTSTYIYTPHHLVVLLGPEYQSKDVTLYQHNHTQLSHT